RCFRQDFQALGWYRLDPSGESGFTTNLKIKASYVFTEPTAQEPGRYHTDWIATLLYCFDFLLKLSSIIPHLAEGVLAPVRCIKELLYPAFYSFRLVSREQVLYGLQVER